MGNCEGIVKRGGQMVNYGHCRVLSVYVPIGGFVNMWELTEQRDNL